ncbi:hypothetical protein PDE_00078 [Penicillium oxalicum 114-2]|uniref:Protein BNI4 n=1 Tax=Penicillium oxalicum (strain 114-2 / CGMCC 5302) TaxID=933388 RepID=S8ATJ6_PENO1|nr:hypothetical protein PDE_00078 [Penicillium oxalicum 114-2]
MAALVQTISQHSSTVPVLQTRPTSSSSNTFIPPTIPNSGPVYQNMSWGTFNNGNTGVYRPGHPVVAPYAYTPSLSPGAPSPTAQHRQSWAPHLRPEHRTSSAPAIHQVAPHGSHSGTSRSNNPAAGSVSNSSSSNASFRSHLSKDDTALPSRPLRTEQPPRPVSMANLPSPTVPSPSASATTAKPSPNRYRRPNQQRADSFQSQSSGLVSTPPAVEDKVQSGSAPVLRSPGHNRVSSVDDASPQEKSQPELAKRYRRRSLGTMDSATYPHLDLQLPTPAASSPQPGAYDFIAFDSGPRPRSSHSHRDSVASAHSTQSSSSSLREASPSETGSTTGKAGRTEDKRVNKPSPLSQQPSSTPESPKVAPAATQKSTTATSPPEASPAAKRLAELKNDQKRPGKSRLRRAFSFGSASELLKASSAQQTAARREAAAAEQARREALREELGEEQAAIAEQQEASGLGESIYSHQGNFFRGSTDALSVSSTASSASMMLRKMGKGMKRGGRSLVGLFRPKSIASVSSLEGAGASDQPMAAPKISVINVEGERAELESVTVNPDPQDMPRGGTVFPRSEGPSEPRRSVSVRERSQQRSVSDNTADTRKSIMGGDRERAEVLSKIRKTRGILKKTHSDLGVSLHGRAQNGSDSPHSSAPPTPDDGSRAARPGEHIKIAGEDYFMSQGGRFTGDDPKSAPMTPQPTSRNIMFSPRIQFHDTWPSGEYDRRGDIATCNRLTPLLAQQIREEINNFKMEMEVHENSKIYTHFI